MERTVGVKDIHEGVWSVVLQSKSSVKSSPHLETRELTMQAPEMAILSVFMTPCMNPYACQPASIIAFLLDDSLTTLSAIPRGAEGESSSLNPKTCRPT
jgi:hypothetical protein